MTFAWNDCEERDFAKLMAAGKLERRAAIRAYRRYLGNMDKALRYVSRGITTQEQGNTQDSSQNRVAGSVLAPRGKMEGNTI